MILRGSLLLPGRLLCRLLEVEITRFAAEETLVGAPSLQQAVLRSAFEGRLA